MAFPGPGGTEGVDIFRAGTMSDVTDRRVATGAIRGEDYLDPTVLPVAPRFAGLRRLFNRVGARALLVYALIALIPDFPIYPGDPSRVPTFLGEDIVQTAWFLEWTPWALLHGKNLFETNLLNVPLGVDLAQNTGIPLLGLLASPLTLTAGPVASENFLRWIAFFLSAYAAFAVLRRFVDWAPAAFLGGLLYGFSPYMVAEGSVHLNLVFVPLPPVILYLCFELCVTQRRPAVRTGAWLGLACAAQFFISDEVLTTTALIAAIGVFVLFFTCIGHVRSNAGHALLGIAIAALILCPLAAYPVWLAFHGHAHYVGPAQGSHNVYNADLLGPVLPTSNQLVTPEHLRSISAGLVGNNPQENGSYLGIPLIVVCGVILWRYWRRLWPIFLTLMALTAFVLSLGPELVVNGHAHDLPFGLPFRKIDRLPALNNILPVRFSLYVAFFVAVLIAYGADQYRRDVLARRRLLGQAPLPRSVLVGRGAGAVLCLASLVALVPNWPYRTFNARPNPSERPDVLAIIPKGSIVLAYPYPTPFADQAMLWQALDRMRFRLIGGYALVPNAAGKASVFPATLQPTLVQSMLVNSITPTPDPGLADVVATAETLEAERVIVERTGAKRPHPLLAADVVGRVASVDQRQGSFVIDVTNTKPVGVAVGRQTVYVEPGARRPSLVGVAPGRWVIVSGRATTGTVNPHTVAELRTFLAVNHVQAVVDDLGLRDSWEIGIWIRDAIGRPDRAGGGGEIWIDVPRRLAERRA